MTPALEAGRVAESDQPDEVPQPRGDVEVEQCGPGFDQRLFVGGGAEPEVLERVARVGHEDVHQVRRGEKDEE